MKTIVKSKNAKVKYKYFKRLKEAEGFNDRTVQHKISEIAEFENFIGGRDFSIFNKKIAIEFKEYLQLPRENGKTLSKKTIFQRLYTVRKFYQWLILQPGYRCRLKLDHIDYLNLSRKDRKALYSSRRQKRVPTLEYVISLINSINSETEVGKRDRACIAFLLMSGVRIKTLTKIYIGAIEINDDNIIVWLNPLDGIEMKSGKGIQTILLDFDHSLKNELLEYLSFLKNIKKFSPQDPLFPAIDQKMNPATKVFDSDRIEPKWRIS